MLAFTFLTTDFDEGVHLGSLLFQDHWSSHPFGSCVYGYSFRMHCRMSGVNLPQSVAETRLAGIRILSGDAQFEMLSGIITRELP